MVDFKKKLEEASKRINNAITPIKGSIAPILFGAGMVKEVQRRSEQEKAKGDTPKKTSVSKKPMASSSTPIQDRAKARQTQITNGAVSNIKPSMSRQDVQSMIVNIAQQEGVDPSLALAVAQQESGFNPSAVGDGGKSFGLFQIHQPSHPDYKGGTNPEANARYGIRYLKNLLDANNGNVHDALWSYNAGSGNKAKGVLPASTKQYIANITNLAGQFDKQGFSNVAQAPTDNRPVMRGMTPANTQQLSQPVQMAAVPLPQKPEAVTTTPDLEVLKTQLQQQALDPRNADLSIPTMYNRLRDRYADLQNEIRNQDPRYQGQIVQGERYYVNPKELQQRMQFDRMVANEAMLRGQPTPTQSRANDYLAEQQAMYQIAKANEAGVPYADYQAALLDRQKQMISAKAAQIESELKMALANEDNVFKKQQLIALIENNAMSAQNTLNNLDYQIQNTNYQSQVSGMNNLYLQQLKNVASQQKAEDDFKNQLMLEEYKAKLKQQYPSNTNQWSAVNAMNAMAGYDPQKAGQLLEASGLGPQLFPNMTPEQAQQIFGTGKPQPSQGGILDMLRRKAGLIGGDIQANEL
nr:MAG TPA: hypothetical protein [Caudoviricetes sp.]